MAHCYKTLSQNCWILCVISNSMHARMGQTNDERAMTSRCHRLERVLQSQISHMLLWWRYIGTNHNAIHKMVTLSASLALCVGNPAVIAGFPSQRASVFILFTKGQRYEALVFGLGLAGSYWRNNRVFSDLRRHHAHLYIWEESQTTDSYLVNISHTLYHRLTEI